MFLEAAILGVVIGLVRNGSIRNISVTKIRGWFLAIIAFVLQISTLIFRDMSIVQSYGRYVYIASAVLIILTLAINLNKRGMWIILIGAILNFVVVIMNGNKMPISLDGLELAGLQNMIEGIKSGDITNYMAIDQVTNWTKHLGKYIVIPKPYPMAKVISIGDIFMSLGIILLVQGQMIKPYLITKSRMVSVGYRGKM
ncbi:DUF5317 domain-containing protein [Wukongibacter baidiensis]|uniref:DUF5317 domain-containing protein n=1 Tax=Wukongibacter baidiensis TaxID=1723361 RepID=UPI003D7F5B17